jgi:hypothetical protein
VQGIDKTSRAFVKANNNTAVPTAEAVVNGVDANGFTLDWTVNDAANTEILYLALGPLSVGSGCAAGTAPTGANKVVNGDFRTGTGDCATWPPGPFCASLPLLAQIGFTSDLPTTGDGYVSPVSWIPANDQSPDDSSFAFQNGAKCYDFMGGTDCFDYFNQSAFPGDPAYGVPAASTWLGTSGNTFAGPGPYKVWEQTVNGLTPGTNYTFYVYASNALRPGYLPGWNAPVLNFYSGTGPLAGRTLLAGGAPSYQVFEEAVNRDTWKRYQTTFNSGAATSVTLSIWNSSEPGDPIGDDLALAQVGVQQCVAATEVSLLSFDARAASSGVELRWQTASELDNLGFHLHRAVAEAGPYERITKSIIPGLGSSPVGASYAYVDAGLVPGQLRVRPRGASTC